MIAHAIPTEKQPEIRVKSSPPFKLKDRPNRQFVRIRLSDFGFMPEEIIIYKVPNSNNKFVINAILTPDEIKKQDEQMKKLNKKGVKDDGSQSTTNKKG